MNADARKVFRFAPSPNGYLHLGPAYSALRNADLARRSGGRMLVRLEDIDVDRCRKEYEVAILEDLEWLGIVWEKPERRQSQHFADYAVRLEELRERRLVYPCFCSRGDISRVVAAAPSWPRDPDGAPLYPGTCRHMSAAERNRRLAAGQHAALRIDMDEALAQAGGRIAWCEYGEGDTPCEVAAEPSVWGDTVVARRDIPTSYHIAVVVDDALQGVSDVVRGMDLFNATSLHRLLQHLLGLPAPTYRHHHLLREGAGNKLSKSTRAKSIRSIRADGLTLADLRKRFQLD